MKKIAYVCNPYHWESYSVLRTLYEALRRRKEVTTLLCRRTEKAPPDVDQIWVFSSMIPIKNPRKKFMVVIGSAEPSKFIISRFRAADVYATWSTVVHKKYPSTFFLPLHADSRYFKPLGLQKTVDCVFLGVAGHPRIKTRRASVAAIRARGISVLVGGQGWGKHKHNRKFLAGGRLIQAYNRARLALDLTNETTSMSSRLFQSAMCGVPVVTMRRDDTAEMFEPDKEIFLYDNDAELPRFVEGLLKDKARLARVGEAARQRALRDHDVDARLDSLLKWTTKAYAEWKKK